MAKIIKITESNVTIVKDDQSFLTLEKRELSFNPELDMAVEVFEVEGEVVVNRVKREDIQDKINIQINNANSNVNSNVNTVVAVPYGAKSVNKMIYLLLVFFLGSIGGHHFYAGKVMKGLMYLLFCWTFIPAVLAFFALISAAFKPADAMGNIWV